MTAAVIIGLVGGVLTAGGGVVSFLTNRTLTTALRYKNDYDHLKITHPSAYKYLNHLLACLGCDMSGDTSPYWFYKNLSSDLQLLLVQVTASKLRDTVNTGDLVASVGGALQTAKVANTLDTLGAYVGTNFFMNTLSNDTLTGYWLRFYSWFRTKGYFVMLVYIVSLLLFRLFKRK